MGPISTATVTLSAVAVHVRLPATDALRGLLRLEHVSSQVVGARADTSTEEPVQLGSALMQGSSSIVAGQEVGDERDEYHYQDDERA